MKGVAFMVIFAVLLSCTSFAQQPECDYKAEILVNGTEFEARDFQWRMRAMRISGAPTNVTGAAEITDSRGHVVRNYNLWANESISRQKTSGTYSPNLDYGEYQIKSYIEVGCNDTDKSNNADVKKIRIIFADREIGMAKANGSCSVLSGGKASTAENGQGASENETYAKPGQPMDEYDNVIQLHNYSENEQHICDIPRIAFESSSEKAKNVAVMALLALSILLNIVLIWKR